ncbi:tyrosine-type recombinase/integrase [Microbacterium paludicola]|uniref:Site-specific integrase n=1 Tax=Microbacterium paludicola TaxID=300019 RepID=A0A4Y9FXB7_9MICO|nr:tyrosine-type recombinase/integrase [Microbacterium paludicola]MBF0816061.1 site-specific integrase [Microbacterium paludicola]TFU33248.1 site-specific integrase [Microbacterium paludicola]
MGSVHAYQAAKGRRYEARYRKPNGKQGAKRGFTRKRDAEIWLAEIETSRAKGSFIDPQAARATVDMLGPIWIEAKRHSMKPSSFAPVETAWRLRVQPKWGGWEVADIRHTDIRAWVAELTQSTGATVTIRTFGVLASILDDAVYDGRIAVNPARVGRIGLPRKSRGRHVYLTHEEVFRLARAAGDRKLLVLVLAYTGIRWGEAVALRVDDIDFERGRFRIRRNAVEVHGKIHVGTPKSHTGRAVPVPKFLLDQLAIALQGRSRHDLALPGVDGGYLRRTRSDDGSRSWFKTALATAELPNMTTHDLRHTAASLAVQSGANVKTIQRMLGHTSAAMTLDVYSDLFDEDLDAVSKRLDKGARKVGVDKLF